MTGRKTDIDDEQQVMVRKRQRCKLSLGCAKAGVAQKREAVIGAVVGKPSHNST